jgi:hypothetical protein
MLFFAGTGAIFGVCVTNLYTLGAVIGCGIGGGIGLFVKYDPLLLVAYTRIRIAMKLGLKLAVKPEVLWLSRYLLDMLRRVREYEMAMHVKKKKKKGRK